MQRTKWMAVVGSALGLLAAACAGDDGGGGTTGPTATVSPPVVTGTMPPTAQPGAAGSMAPPAMTPPTNTMTGGGTAPPPATTGGSGAPMMMPMAGSAAPMAGSAAPMPMGDASMCPPAPDGAPDAAVAALAAINTARVAAGAGCVHMVAEINKAAENHCKYYVMNKDTMCTSNPHLEVESCMGFTGMGPGNRMMAAGYSARYGGGEVMAFLNDPQGSVDTWINSVWHRLPMLDPWTGDMGYGADAGGCDTMDFGSSAMAPADSLLVYPYDGQTNVPISFNGQYEGPMPPAPPSGWPSASPITVYGRMLNITEHTLTKDGDTAPIEHMWLTGADADYAQYLRTAVMIYGNAPFTANTKYHMHVKGTYQGGALEKDWSFTTGAAPTWPGRGGG